MQDTFWLQVSQNKETAHRVPESPSQVIFCPKKIQSRRPILSRAKFSSNHFWSSWVVSCPLTREATKPAMKPSFDDFWVRGCALVESGGRTESFWRLFSTQEGGLVNVTKTRNPSWTLHKRQKCDRLICNSSISIFRSATHLTSDSNSFRPLKILQKLQVGLEVAGLWRIFGHLLNMKKKQYPTPKKIG